MYPFYTENVKTFLRLYKNKSYMILFSNLLTFILKSFREFYRKKIVLKFFSPTIKWFIRNISHSFLDFGFLFNSCLIFWYFRGPTTIFIQIWNIWFSKFFSIDYLNNYIIQLYSLSFSKPKVNVEMVQHGFSKSLPQWLIDIIAFDVNRKILSFSSDSQAEKCT